MTLISDMKMKMMKYDEDEDGYDGDFSKFNNI